MCEDEQINVSIETILTYKLFDFKGFCDTLAFLNKNMILFCYKYHHKDSSLANRTERTLLHEEKPPECKRPTYTTDWIAREAWLLLRCRDEPIAKRISDDHSTGFAYDAREADCRDNTWRCSLHCIKTYRARF